MKKNWYFFVLQVEADAAPQGKHYEDPNTEDCLEMSLHT